MEKKRLPYLLELLRQRPHSKALLKGSCEGVLRFYQSRQGVLVAAEIENISAESACILRINTMEIPLSLCQGYGCMIFLSDHFTLHQVTGTSVSLSDKDGVLLAEGLIRGWDSL